MSSPASEAYDSYGYNNYGSNNSGVMQRNWGHNEDQYYAAPSDTVVTVKFDGDLAGLARVLEPAITVEKARQGLSATR